MGMEIAVASRLPPFEKRRRFFKAVDVAPADGGWAVRLDGRTPRSAAGQPLKLPTESLARLVAGEWEAQTEEIDAAAMPATRLAWAAIADATRASAADRIVAFASTDLLCYFAERPAALVERQERRWGQVIEWAEQTLGLEFRRVEGVIHRPQPHETIERVRALAGATPDFALAGLDAATTLFGSAILGFALARGALSGMAAFELSRLDEAFQEETWGVDAEAARRAEAMADEAQMLDRWFRALAPEKTGA